MINKLNISRRTQIKLLSYSLALIAVLVGFIITGFSQAEVYRRNIEYGYNYALDELSDSIGNIDIALQKSVYAGSSNQFNTMATKLWMESSVAKSCLGRLPTSENDLTNVNQFISQVGDFALAMSRKLSLDEDLTSEEKENLEKLSSYASSLKDSINQLQTEFNHGRLWDGEIRRTIQKADNREEQNADINNGFRTIEDAFTDYPSLIYDGPFSDHIMEREPIMTKDMEEIDREKAREAAAKFLDVSTDKLDDASDTDGKMPTYGFYCKDKKTSISVTKKGSVIASAECDWTATEQKLDLEEALNKADEIILQKGFKNMKRSYYELSENICIINYTYEVDKITVYTDMIKIGLSMQDGTLTLFDAKSYIMNHKERDGSIPKVTREQAQAIVSNNLSVKESSLAIIPSQGKNEIFCYEFLCEGRSGEDTVLVYINADTLVEEEILIMLKDDNGIVTM